MATRERALIVGAGAGLSAALARACAGDGMEVVLAARLLRWRGIPCRIRLVGNPDEHNLSSLRHEDLSAWKAEGIVEWDGHQDDIAEVWHNSHVCILPSYREGLPKSLQEAAACGRPIITTDVPGCRAVVSDGVEGLLVPPNDWTALAAAMQRLALSPELRSRMGHAARLRAEAEFDLDLSVSQTMALYGQFLARP